MNSNNLKNLNFKTWVDLFVLRRQQGVLTMLMSIKAPPDLIFCLLLLKGEPGPKGSIGFQGLPGLPVCIPLSLSENYKHNMKHQRQV